MTQDKRIKNISVQLSASELETLYQQQIIDDAAYNYIVANLLAPRRWALWLLRLSLALGIALILVGIIFFFAYNWAQMSNFAKFALLQAALLLCFGTSFAVGVRKLLGQYLLLAATVLIGVFFAVFGQIYRTAADEWQLFALWALLMLPFIALAHLPAQWLLQWFITGLALFLWMAQYIEMHVRQTSKEFLLLTALSSIYCAFVWLAQLYLQRRWQWLANYWLHYLNLLALNVFALIYFIVAIFGDFNLAMLAAPLLLIALFFLQKKNFAAQLLLTINFAIMLGFWIIYQLNKIIFTHLFSDVFITFSTLLITLILTLIVYKFLLKLKSYHEKS